MANILKPRKFNVLDIFNNKGGREQEKWQPQRNLSSSFATLAKHWLKIWVVEASGLGWLNFYPVPLQDRKIYFRICLAVRLIKNVKKYVFW